MAVLCIWNVIMLRLPYTHLLFALSTVSAISILSLSATWYKICNDSLSKPDIAPLNMQISPKASVAQYVNRRKFSLETFLQFFLPKC